MKAKLGILISILVCLTIFGNFCGTVDSAQAQSQSVQKMLIGTTPVTEGAAAGGGGGIAYGNKTSKAESITSQTFTLTAPAVSGANKVMVLFATFNTASDYSPTATYNLASLGAPVYSEVVNYIYLAVWIVTNPASAADFVVDMGGSLEISYTLHAAYFTGVNQSTPYRTAAMATGTSNPATVSVTNSQSGDLIVGCFGIDDTSALNGMTEARIGAGQAYISTVHGGDAAGSLDTEPGASGTVVHSWDFVDNGDNGWGVIAIPLIPAPII